MRNFFSDLRYNINRTFQSDPAAKSKWEIVLFYPHIKAIVFHHIAHNLYLKKHYLLARCMGSFSRNWTGIEIHPGATIGRGLIIDHGMGVVIGETAIIGDDCLIYHGVTLGCTGQKQGKRHPTIQDNVMIGAGAKILGNITIGANSKIGANTIVLHSCVEDSILIGSLAVNKETEKEML